jgi:hypothetical protein
MIAAHREPSAGYAEGFFVLKISQKPYQISPPGRCFDNAAKNWRMQQRIKFKLPALFTEFDSIFCRRSQTDQVFSTPSRPTVG